MFTLQLASETKRCKTLEKSLMDQKNNFLKFEETMRLIEADYVQGIQNAELVAQKRVQVYLINEILIIWQLLFKGVVVA